MLTQECMLTRKRLRAFYGTQVYSPDHPDLVWQSLLVHPWHEIALLACENKNPLCFEIFANSPARPIVAARMPRKLNRPRYALPNPATICHCAF